MSQFLPLNLSKNIFEWWKSKYLSVYYMKQWIAKIRTSSDFRHSTLVWEQNCLNFKNVRKPNGFVWISDKIFRLKSKRSWSFESLKSKQTGLELVLFGFQTFKCLKLFGLRSFGYITERPKSERKRPVPNDRNPNFI